MADNPKFCKIVDCLPSLNANVDHIAIFPSVSDPISMGGQTPKLNYGYISWKHSANCSRCSPPLASAQPLQEE